MMGEEMGDRLQQTLRSLCYKTQWKYAVFWKLKRRARMMLTWEDAYYENHDPSDPYQNRVANMCSTDALENLHGNHYMGDPLGLAVAKLSYLMYSLGEGIIGQVAFTGKHRWIFADEPASISMSSKEHLDGWQSQFSAGIKTVVVVACAPCGVVQLGSLNLVVEDLNLVSHIKDAFGLLQSSSAAFIPDSKSVASNGCPHGLDQAVRNKRPILQPHLLPSPGKYSDLSNDNLLPCFHQSEIFQVSAELPVFGGKSFELVGPRSGNHTSEFQKQVLLKQKSGLENSNCFTEMCSGGKCNVVPSYNVHSQNVNLNTVGPLVDACKVDNFYSPLVFDHADWDKIKSGGVVYQGKGQQLPEPLEMQVRNVSEGESMFQGYGTCVDIMNPPLKFSAGCELHEALGSSFKNGQDIRVWSEAGSAEISGLVYSPDGVLSSLFSGSEGPEHLLEAVVANAFPGASNVTCEKSSCKSAHSLLTTESILHSAKHIKHESSAIDQVQSSIPLANEDTYQSMNSTEVVTLRSTNEASSKTRGTCSESSDRYVEPAKISRKRARPGENCKPRPRDRQLIQDRIKELREIVPNGSKCSIDTLLERTIKHKHFLQSITSYADKIKCAESKISDKVSRLLGTCSHEHGASWALEVGVHSNACPIIVENLNMNGQMLVEMLCEECSSFFNIVEVIRDLGYTILKGVTESRAEKTWACFVVEGQGNGSSQRMDILYSLMQLLQHETRI